MAVESRVICDRCGEVILSDRNALDVRCGPLKGRFESADLCEDCGRQFALWLKAGAPELAGVGQAAHP